MVSKKTNTGIIYLIITLLFYLFIDNFGIDLLGKIFSGSIPSIITFTLMTVVAIILVTLLKDDFQYDLQRINADKKKLWLVPLFIFLFLAVDIVLQNLITVQSNNQNNLTNAIQKNGPIGNCLILLMTVIIGPIVEEVIFQYFLQRKLFKENLLRIGLNSKVAKTVAVLLATVLFMMFHMQSISELRSIVFFSYSDLFLLGLVYEITDENLVLAISVHSISNLVAFLSIFIS